MRKLALLALAVSVGTAAADAATIPVTVSSYGQVGQTSIYRADLSALVGTVSSVTIVDQGAPVGSSGIFSGVDVDFVVFDADGDPTTTGDQLVPLTSAATAVTPGVVRTASDGSPSAYQPTADHPGPLFGLEADQTIDHATATLGTRDGTYWEGVYFDVDHSDGWVSLGQGGALRAAFGLLGLTGESMYLLIGDAGPPAETLGADVEINLEVGSVHAPIIDLAGPYYLSPGETINLDGVPSDGGEDIVGWKWDLDGDGQFDDGMGPSLTAGFEFFNETLGLPVGDVDIALQVTLADDSISTYGGQIVLVPEPGCLVLLGAGAAAVVRRRRR
jgi:hypothetical protein